MRKVRFGITDGARFSPYWKVTATTKRPELVIMGSRTGSFHHLTMHEDPAHWHLKVRKPTGEFVRPWAPPADRLPGVRRLVRLLLPVESVRYGEPAGASHVTWVPEPPGATDWVEFTVLHCRRGVPEVRGADVIGGVDLADGSIAMVLARSRAGEEGSFTFHADDLEAAKRELRAPNRAMLVDGVDPDGCLWILQLYGEWRAPAGA